MTEAQKLLGMIKAVDQADTAWLDEIDAHAHKFFYRWSKSPSYIIEHISEFPLKRYTRSRDVLKSHRPEGWYFNMSVIYPIDPHKRLYRCDGYHSKFKNDPYEFGSVHHHCRAELRSECLAELHAIVQAEEYMRQREGER